MNSINIILLIFSLDLVSYIKKGLNCMQIIITGGGTGGHLSVAKSFAIYLNSINIQPIYIGSNYGQDRDWFEDNAIFKKTYFMDTRGVVNQKSLGKIISLYKISIAVIKSILIIKKHNITKVISVGGYSSASASIAAIITQKELYIHEQNAISGTLNSLLKRFAKRFFSSYIKPYDDYPIQETFFLHARLRKTIKTIIFLGGSQGAKAINDLAIKIAPTLTNLKIDIIHQTGKNDFNRVKESYKRLNIKAELFDFSDQLIQKLHSADLAICRSGASTIWELCAINLPAIYIPYPYAASNHQFYNAKFLDDKNASLVISQENLDHKKIIQTIKNIDILSMSQILATLISKDGTKKIIQEIIS